MKKSLRLIVCCLSICFERFVIPLSLSSVAGVVVLTSGCRTSQTTVAYKSVASLQVGVSTALTAWADYVVATRSKLAALPDGPQKLAGQAKLSARELVVRRSLDRYKLAASAAQVGVEAGLKDDAPPTAEMLSAGTEMISATKTHL
jgi:hypothetical protein